MTGSSDAILALRRQIHTVRPDSAGRSGLERCPPGGGVASNGVFQPLAGDDATDERQI